MKEQNLDFETARDFFVEMKYLKFRIVWKKNVGMLDSVI